MKNQEREELVASLARYIAAMGPHQRERRGGRLILRCFDVLKKIRVVELTEPEHCDKLLEKEAVEQGI